MKNRVSKYPGRVLITPDDGTPPFYATLTRADEPIEEGTPLNKATLLTDETAALYGFDDSAVPDDVFANLFLREQWKVVGTKKYDFAGGGKLNVAVNLTDDLRNYREFIVLSQWKKKNHSNILNVNIHIDNTPYTVTRVNLEAGDEDGYTASFVVPIIKTNLGLIIPAMYATNINPTPIITQEIKTISVSTSANCSASDGSTVIVLAK